MRIDYLGMGLLREVKGSREPNACKALGAMTPKKIIKTSIFLAPKNNFL
jgi:hypothetical protein